MRADAISNAYLRAAQGLRAQPGLFGAMPQAAGSGGGAVMAAKPHFEVPLDRHHTNDNPGIPCHSPTSIDTP
jgi:hypothetical protein